MPATVRVSGTLRALMDGRDEVSAPGQTVAEVIGNLDASFPDLSAKLLDGRGARRFVNIFVNQTDIRRLDGINTPVESGDEIYIIAGVAGG